MRYIEKRHRVVIVKSGEYRVQTNEDMIPDDEERWKYEEPVFNNEFEAVRFLAKIWKEYNNKLCEQKLKMQREEIRDIVSWNKIINEYSELFEEVKK